MRYARTLELPASRGRIIDRNGQVLASSVPAPSIWAIPKDIERRPPAARAAGAGCSDMTPAELRQAARRATRTSSGCKRQVDEDGRAQIVKALNLKGIHQLHASTSASTRRARPRRTWWASPTSRTSGQEGIELALPEGAGRAGTARAASSRTASAASSRTSASSVPPVDGQRHRSCRSTRKVQFFAYQRCATRWPSTRPRPAAWWCSTCRPARCWRWPTTRATSPNDRQQPDRRAAAQPRADRHLRARLDDEALHRRAGAGNRPASRRDADPDRARPHDRSAARRSATRTRTAC